MRAINLREIHTFAKVKFDVTPQRSQLQPIKIFSYNLHRLSILNSELINWGVNVVVADPWADPLDVHQSHNITLDKVDSNHKVDSLIVAVGHKEFRGLSPEDLRSFCRGSAPVLADVKSLYDRNALVKQGFSVFRL